VAVRSLSALGRTVPTDTAQSLSLSTAAADVYDNDDVGDGDSGPPSSAYVASSCHRRRTSSSLGFFQGHQLARRAIAFSIAKLKQFVVDKMTWSRRTTLYEHTAEQGENNTLLRNIIIPASNSRTREIELKRVGPGE